MPRLVILICTCDRPQLLERLLKDLWPQAHKLGAPIVIIDNGRIGSHHIVAEFEQNIAIHYERLCTSGLVHARNASLRAALNYSPDLLAFIDDDEFPTENWLQFLLMSFRETDADIVVGPVEPHYVVPPAKWVDAGRFFEKSGETLCTSNLLLRTRTLPKDEADWFRKEFNRTGGEDNEFLNRLVARGAKRAVASRAIVKEVIPPERATVGYLCRRGFRDGVVITQMERARHKSTLTALVTITRHCALKSAYALNHLFWSPKEPWRLPKSLADFSTIVGMIYRFIGFDFAMYGSDK